MTDAKDRIEQVIKDSGEPIDVHDGKPLEPDPHPDRTREFVSTGFSRIRTDWDEADAGTMAIIRKVARDTIQAEFRVAFAITERLRRAVREQAVDPGSGELLTDDDGGPVWAEEDGIPVENWSQLQDRERVNALHAIALFLGEWEQTAIDKWAAAMFAKVNWEQAFAHGFTALPGVSISGKPTIEDRTNWGQRISVDERYFAVFCTYVSKSAETQVKAMNRLYYLLDKTSPR